MELPMLHTHVPSIAKRTCHYSIQNKNVSIKCESTTTKTVHVIDMLTFNSCTNARNNNRNTYLYIQEQTYTNVKELIHEVIISIYIENMKCSSIKISRN